MPGWNDILLEIQESGGAYDEIRRKYLKKLFCKTQRNIIAYYSGWLNKKIPNLDYGIKDIDKHGLMNAVKNLPKDKGLDLILHTPGGELSATESLIDYLRKIFGKNIRTIVPQLAMSGGTMMALSGTTIIMGKQSSLGPIDPQLAGISAHGVIEEFEQAHKEIKADSSKIPIWQPIIAKYRPTLIGDCQKSLRWAGEIATENLKTGMFSEMKEQNQDGNIASIVNALRDHAFTKSHDRHLSAEKCKEIGLEIKMMEDDNDLQDLILSVHHCMILTFTHTSAFKIIENHDRKAYVLHAQVMQARK